MKKNHSEKLCPVLLKSASQNLPSMTVDEMIKKDYARLFLDGGSCDGSCIFKFCKSCNSFKSPDRYTHHTCPYNKKEDYK